MSDFKYFISNIGQDSNFKFRKLLFSLIEESKKDTEKYNNLLELINNYWRKYKERAEFSNLLKDHYYEIFTFYFCKIFPFREDKLVFEDPKVLNPSDFRMSITYSFNQTEIDIVENVRKKIGIKKKIKNILQSIFYLTISSFSAIIENVYRPYVVQFSAKYNYEKLVFIHNDEIEVICRFNLREY